MFQPLNFFQSFIYAQRVKIYHNGLNICFGINKASYDNLTILMKMEVPNLPKTKLSCD